MSGASIGSAVAVGEEGAGERSSFADRLDYLFRQVRPRGRGEYTYEEVARGVAEAGYEISATYVWQLRNGKRANPTLRHIEGLAEFFGVPPAYFLDPETQRRVDAELLLVASLRDAGVRNLALRAHGLSPDGLAAIETMIEHIRKSEGVGNGG